MTIDKISYPSHPVRCIITGSSECGKSVSLTNLILNIIIEYDKIYIYSPSLDQHLYQKLNKCFTNYIPIHVIANISNAEGFDVVIEEIVNNKELEKTDIEIETYGSIEELKFPQEYDDGGIIILDDLNEKGINDPRVQAMLKRSRNNNLSIFIFSQEYYELPKKTVRSNGNINHIFKPNHFLDVRNVYQDKTSMDMILNEFKLLTYTCWNKNHQPLLIDMTEDRYQGRYRLGLKINSFLLALFFKILNEYLF